MIHPVDDDLDAIAMQDMGPERMVRHHHGEHREHRLHSRKSCHFWSLSLCVCARWRGLCFDEWTNGAFSHVQFSMSVDDRCGEWRGRRSQNQGTIAGPLAQIFGRLLCVGLLALLGQLPEAHQPFRLWRIHWTLYHAVHRRQYALHGTRSSRHERRDEPRPQNGKLRKCFSLFFFLFE